jgi:rSAM/selenodomain-associated transferase 1
MAKHPVAGRAKTRLVPPLTGESAASLYHCFLQDVLATVRAAAHIAAFSPGIAYTPSAAQSFFRRLAPDFQLISQQGEQIKDSSLPSPPSSQLGDRLQFVLSTALGQGHQQVVAINSDSPTLPAELLCTAFQRLDDPQLDAVFGPCTDGGYYLIGVKKPPGRLVTEVRMSTPTVLSDTLTIAAEEGMRVDLLPEWYDVDSAADLKRLSAELAAHPDRAPASSRFLTTPWTSTSSSQP